MIRELLTGKNAKDKAQIKAKEIAKLNHKGKFLRGDLEIEITDLKEIEGGIEVFARAWKNGKQLGFGKDGSVDIERFRIYNPPVLVDDPAGDIIQEWIDSITGEAKSRRLKEDLLEAIKQTLEHTIRLVGKENTKVVNGKVGNTTSTFYPDADAESTSVDGVLRWDTTTASAAWATVRGASSAATVQDTIASEVQARLKADDTNTNEWEQLDRGVFLFDTSALPDTDQIDSATFSTYVTAKSDTLTQSLRLVTSAPASNTGLAGTDFNITNFSNLTGISADKTIAGVTTSAYNDFALTNTTVVANTGITKIGLLIASDAANTEPTYSAGADSYIVGYFADQTGTTNDPKLVVVHSEPVSGGSARRLFLMGM